MKRKICVVTGSRAEYGLLKPLIAELKGNPKVSLQIIVTGMHLSAEFGLTFKQIVKDGFSISQRVEMLLSSDTPEGITKSIGLGLIGFAAAYQRLQPDIVVLLGDRFEILAAAIAAHVASLPIGHIQGGELTEGNIDDAFRHAITKMSHLHFTSTAAYRKRVIQLGESAGRVFNVGALGIETIRTMRFMSKLQLEKDLRVTFKKRNLLVTYHPQTLQRNCSRQHFQALLDALGELKDTFIIFTKANADTDGRAINTMIDEYVSLNRASSAGFVSLGQERYLSLIRCVDAVVGNSSSGIIEAPSFKIGTIDIGERQKGRIKAASVIAAKPTQGQIRKAFNTLYSPSFQARLKTVKNPYASKASVRPIARILSSYPLGGLLDKDFNDSK